MQKNLMIFLLLVFFSSRFHAVDPNLISNPRDFPDQAVSPDFIGEYEENGKVPSSYISDFFHFLQSDDFKQINNHINKQIIRKTKFEIYVVVADKFDAESLTSAAQTIFTNFRIKDKGFLIILDVDLGDYMIMSGSGTSSYIYEKSYKKIIDKMDEKLNNGNHKDVIMVGIEGLEYKILHPDFVVPMVVSIVVVVVALLIAATIVICCVHEKCYADDEDVELQIDNMKAELEVKPSLVFFSPLCPVCMDQFSIAHQDKMSRYVDFLALENCVSASTVSGSSPQPNPQPQDHVTSSPSSSSPSFSSSPSSSSTSSSPTVGLTVEPTLSASPSVSASISVKNPPTADSTVGASTSTTDSTVDASTSATTAATTTTTTTTSATSTAIALATHGLDLVSPTPCFSTSLSPTAPAAATHRLIVPFTPSPAVSPFGPGSASGTSSDSGSSSDDDDIEMGVDPEEAAAAAAEEDATAAAKEATEEQLRAEFTKMDWGKNSGSQIQAQEKMQGQAQACTEVEVDDVMTLRCGHQVHRICIDVWCAAHHDVCPVCGVKNPRVCGSATPSPVNMQYVAVLDKRIETGGSYSTTSHRHRNWFRTNPSKRSAILAERRIIVKPKCSNRSSSYRTARSNARKRRRERFSGGYGLNSTTHKLLLRKKQRRHHHHSKHSHREDRE